MHGKIIYLTDTIFQTLPVSLRDIMENISSVGYARVTITCFDVIYANIDSLYSLHPTVSRADKEKDNTTTYVHMFSEPAVVIHESKASAANYALEVSRKMMPCHRQKSACIANMSVVSTKPTPLRSLSS